MTVETNDLKMIRESVDSFTKDYVIDTKTQAIIKYHKKLQIM